MKAASMGNTYMCQKLIDAGADPKLKDPHGKTAIDQAILFDNVAAKNLILKALQEEK